MGTDLPIERAVAGDPDAQRALIERVYPRVRALVHAELQRSFRRNHRWILPLFSTSDFVHDVLGQVLRRMTSFEGDVEALVGYLAGAVTHRLIDAVRHHEAARRDESRRVALDTELGIEELRPSRGPTPLEQVSLGEQLDIFRRVLATLEPRDRELVELRLVDELEFGAIADRLGLASGNTARKAFLRAQARLAVRLGAAGLRAADGAEPDAPRAPSNETG
ncbi:MAG: sigma-70 family RNA polymerase sigma factor [Planctomycetes bacterium]|nr:sigma-70 family RNA polymerase sigma factor [Planctomycetota bacterium]